MLQAAANGQKLKDKFYQVRECENVKVGREPRLPHLGSLPSLFVLIKIVFGGHGRHGGRTRKPRLGTPAKPCGVLQVKRCSTVLYSV